MTVGETKEWNLKMMNRTTAARENLRDRLDEITGDWTGDFGVSFRGDALTDALNGDDPFYDFEGALNELESEASEVLAILSEVRKIVGPAYHDAQVAADEVEPDDDNEDYEVFETRRLAARNVAFVASINGTGQAEE